MVDFNDRVIRISKDKLNTYQYLTILLKKLSKNEILTNLCCNFDVSFTFNKINKYELEKQFLFNDEPNNMITKYYLKESQTKKVKQLVYNTKTKDNDVHIDEHYVNKFKNYFSTDSINIYGCDFIIECKFFIKPVGDDWEYELDDPYNKQKLNQIGKNILFYKTYRHSYISFMVFFNKFINASAPTEYNLSTMFKFNGLFSKFDEEDIIELPENDEVIKFIDNVIKYKRMLSKISKNNYVSCTTSIFSIGICEKSIILSINGIQMCNEKMFGRFKYIEHPGIMFFIKSLKLMGKYELLFTKIQKYIIKTL